MLRRTVMWPALCAGLFGIWACGDSTRRVDASEAVGELVESAGGGGTDPGGGGGGGSSGGGTDPGGGGGSGGGTDPCGTECTDLRYTTCTCGSTDPCNWRGDGACDAQCGEIVATPFDDSADCGGGGGGGGIGGYTNDPAQVLGSLDQGFACNTSDGQVVRLALYGGVAELYMFDDDGNRIDIANGTYTTAGGLTLHFEGAAPEPASNLEIELDRLITFSTPTFPYCWVTSSADGFSEERFYACPSIHYIPGVGWDDNYFTLTTYGQAHWRNEQNLSATADTIYTRIWGIYRIGQGTIALAFPNSDEERYLTGTLSADGTEFWIDQLEPERGPCVLQ